MSSPWHKSIPPAERASLHVLPLLLALAWLAAFAFGVYFVAHTKGTSGPVFAFLGVFILIGLVWAGWQGFKIVSLLRADGARLELQDAPPAIGGRLKALVRLPGRAAQASHVMVEFLCMRDHDGDRDAPNEISTGKVWSVRHEFPVRREANGGVAALEFEIPATCLPTGKWISGKRHDLAEDHDIDWQVRVSAVAGRETVEHRFDLKIFSPGPRQAPVDWLRDFAALALVAANLIPIYMVLAGRADLASLAFLYWAENLVIAGYMLLRVICAKLGRANDKIGAVLFFGLWFVIVSVFVGRALLAVVMNLPRNWDHMSSSILDWSARIVQTIGAHIVEAGFAAAVLALVVSHGIGFAQNYIRNGRYRQTRVNREMTRLLNRGVISFGSYFVILGLAPLGTPKYVLAALVLFKTGFEIWLYARERRAVAPGVS